MSFRISLGLLSAIVAVTLITFDPRVCHAFVKPCTDKSPSSRKQALGTPHATSSLAMISKQQLGSFEQLDIGTDEPWNRRVLLLDYTKDPTCRIDFETAWDCQKEIMNQHVERIDDGSYDSFLTTSGGCDTVMMLQHDPVYTLGTGSDEKFVLGLSEDVPTIRMDRGGEVTYHGPGQLTVYPIMDLRSYRQDIHWYMRALEEAIILALSKCGLSHAPERQDEVTGVWVNNHKVAAVGIKCRKWVTMHGLAVNVEDESLSNFGGIVPCGLEGRKVGCINQFIEEPITVNQFALVMKQALEEVFQVELVEGDAI
jgi:lipoyl(octanoyl) transferase